MAKYTIFETTNMAAVHKAERIFDAVADKDIENGTFGYLAELADGEDVIYNFTPGYKEGEDVVVAKNPEWSEDESTVIKRGRRDKYINEAYMPFRAFTVKKRDEFAITIEGITEATRETFTDVTDFTETPVYLTIDNATGKLVASKDKTTGTGFEATVMRKRIVGASLSTPLRNYGYSNPIYEAKVTTLK